MFRDRERSAGSASVAAEGARVRRCTVAIEGVVQGVGFRPFVYRTAVRHGLTGTVRNSLQGIMVEVEGTANSVWRFLDEVTVLPGPIGERHRVTVRWDEPGARGDEFTIESSARDGNARLYPVPDLPVCEACLRELTAAHDRRFGYALLTCAACGPRFTMTRALPYDRDRTTMAGFPPCARCRNEYDDPADRRFHAEGIACADCGPRVTLRWADGAPNPTTDPIELAASALRHGRIVAVKGIGGYHLACSAMAGPAVAEVRRRKRREAKPLAVMVADLEAARALAHVSDAEAGLLTSAARPVVLLRRRADAPIADEVAPDCRELGILLPYSALHHLLLGAVGSPLVMTSANVSDETITYRDDDARQRLRGIADLTLAHDRPIEVPCDDSVARVVRGRAYLVRRSRGYVPLAVQLPVETSRPVLACGGELKHTFALVRCDQAFLSQHLGDLTSETAFREFLHTVEHFQTLFALAPDVVAHDLHPGYRSTAYARSLVGVERIGVQHHHAHVAACLADNGIDRRVIGVAWDGAGHGLDGQVWGGEFLVGDLAGFERAGHFQPVPMPGGDAATREPWRMAGAFLRAAYGDAMTTLDLAFVRRLDPTAWRILVRAADQGLNSPLTSSAGRLFDAVASLLGVRDRVGFEAQAAIELEAVAEPEADTIYSARLDETGGALVVRTPDIVRGVVEDLLAVVPASRIAARFHATLADVLARACERIRARTGLAAVALSGGVFQNVWLLSAAIERLEADGFDVYRHRQVPANDGGLALGQAAVAARQLADGQHA
jgi:hydrogenase maturation protein HypF